MLVFLAGGLIGALSRQPEIERLKAQVRTLQAEIQRLQKVIAEQDRQIKELTIRYKALKGNQFVERAKLMSNAKGAIMFQYLYKEYLELLVLSVRGDYKLGEAETIFFNAFDGLMSGRETSPAEKMLMREYIRAKYSYQIDNMVQPDMEEAVGKVELADVA